MGQSSDDMAHRPSRMSHQRRSGPALSPLHHTRVTWPALQHFFPLILSQRHISRHGIPEGRHVTIVEKERGRQQKIPQRCCPCLRQGRGLAEESMKRYDIKGKMPVGSHRMDRQLPSLIEWTTHPTAVDGQTNSWINSLGTCRMKARR
jgi:hypothetical protein